MISTTRHLKYSYISIFTNLLRTDNEMKSVNLYTTISIKKRLRGQRVDSKEV